MCVCIDLQLVYTVCMLAFHAYVVVKTRNYLAQSLHDVSPLVYVNQVMQPTLRRKKSKNFISHFHNIHRFTCTYECMSISLDNAVLSITDSCDCELDRIFYTFEICAILNILDIVECVGILKTRARR